MPSWLEEKVKIDWDTVTGEICGLPTGFVVLTKGDVLSMLQEYHRQLLAQIGRQRDFDHKNDAELFKVVNEYVDWKRGQENKT